MIRSQSDLLGQDFKPDLTPLLDIIFIVMVFLLLTANISIQTMEVAIPQTQDGAVLNDNDRQAITVNILASEPQWAIDGQTYPDWQVFSQTLLQQTQAKPQHQLIIAPDKQANVEAMLKVLALLQNNHIQATNIMMEESH